MQAEVLRQIERSDAFPSIPQIVMRLLEITRDPEFKQSDVVELLATDPGTSSDILRLANSPLFGVTRRIASVGQAVVLLGMKRVRTLLLGRCLIDRVGSPGGNLIDPSYFWRRSLNTGVLAAHFADQLLPQHRDEAFMGGLLSDVGIIVFANAVPRRYSMIAQSFGPRQPGDLAEIERQALGASHGEVSAMILERWMLPEELVIAIRHHHDDPPPQGLRQPVALLSRMIGGAATIARLLCEVADKEMIATDCAHAMQQVGLDLSALQNVLHAIEVETEELAKIMRIDVIPSRIYAIIAETIAEQVAEVAS